MHIWIIGKYYDSRYDKEFDFNHNKKVALIRDNHLNGS